MHINHLLTKKEVSNYSFQLGVFLIPSAISLSSFFIIISLIIESFKNRNDYLKDKYNLIFLVISFLMIISATTHLFTLKNIYSGKIDPVLSWLGLFNWIPFFWILWSS